jgi:hypothetical protein
VADRLDEAKAAFWAGQRPLSDTLTVQTVEQEQQRFSGRVPSPSPPCEQAAASGDKAGQTGTYDRTRNAGQRLVGKSHGEHLVHSGRVGYGKEGGLLEKTGSAGLAFCATRDSPRVP